VSSGLRFALRVFLACVVLSLSVVLCLGSSGDAGAVGSASCVATFSSGSLATGGPYELACSGVSGPEVDVSVEDAGVGYQLSVDSLDGDTGPGPTFGSVSSSFDVFLPAGCVACHELSGGVDVYGPLAESGLSGLPLVGTIGLYDSSFTALASYGQPGGAGVVSFSGGSVTASSGVVSSAFSADTGSLLWSAGLGGGLVVSVLSGLLGVRLLRRYSGRAVLSS
jgi:hypothetical protein